MVVVVELVELVELVGLVGLVDFVVLRGCSDFAIESLKLLHRHTPIPHLILKYILRLPFIYLFSFLFYYNILYESVGHFVGNNTR